jgi:transcriptional regulator with XRE-family HTH domain
MYYLRRKILGANLAEHGVMLDSMPPRRQPEDKPVHPLRQWRDHRGVSQTQLAELAGTTQGMIGHIERYFRIPRKALMERLVNCTGLPVEAFVLPERFVRENPNFLRRRRRKGTEDHES